MIEHGKDLAEIVALMCTGVFFAYKAYTGYLRLDLSLAIECQRQQRVDGDGDHLVVCVRLHKGPNGSITLHDVQSRISYESTQECLSFVGIERSDTTPDPVGKRRTIDWLRNNSSSPFLKLVPGEETQLSVGCTVPSGAVCLVEVGVLGIRTNLPGPFGQWKASSVSLPRTASHRDPV